MTPAPPPSLETARLLLRPFSLEDAADVRLLAGDREIADTTLTVPHPYDPGVAEAWIATHASGWERGHQVVFAIADASRTLVGAVGLTTEPAHRRAELGYWIGRLYWNRGYATEASSAVIDFGFQTLGLHRIHAMHLVRNPASGRVMIKAGMRHEGTLREHIVKWGKAEDVAVYGMLRTDRLRT